MGLHLVFWFVKGILSNIFQRKSTALETILDQRYASQSTLVCLVVNVRQLVTMTTPVRAHKAEVVLTVNVSLYTDLIFEVGVSPT